MAKRSSVWAHMTKLDRDKVRCNLCSRVFSHYGSTTSLRRHLQTSHADALGSSTPTTVASYAARPKVRATSLLVKLLASGALPPSLLEDKLFQDFVQALEPQYKIPVRQMLTDRLTIATVISESSCEGVPTEIKSCLAVSNDAARCNDINDESLFQSDNALSRAFHCVVEHITTNVLTAVQVVSTMVDITRMYVSKVVEYGQTTGYDSDSINLRHKLSSKFGDRLHFCQGRS